MWRLLSVLLLVCMLLVAGKCAYDRVTDATHHRNVRIAAMEAAL